LGRRLQEPQQQCVATLRNLVVIASLIAHAREDSMAETPPETPAENARRTTTVDSVEAAEEYILMQGNVVNSSNVLQDAFYGIFRVAISLERHEAAASGGTIRFQDHASAIWNVVRSDKLQRDMAIAAISSVPTTLDITTGLSLLRSAGKFAEMLAEYRNILTHSSIVFVQTRDPSDLSKPAWVPIIGGGGTQPATRAKIGMAKGLDLWGKLAADLFLLSRHVVEISIQIQNLDVNSHHPQIRKQIAWPDKPQLQSLPHIREIQRKLLPAAPPTTRRTRRRSSRE
jgi:hypothetical protein